jgi:hypothetical protein
VVEKIEELRPELQLESFGEDEILKRPKIKVPIGRTSEDVPALVAVLPGSRYAELPAVCGSVTVGRRVESA